MDDVEEDIKDMEEVLRRVGGWGRYQKAMYATFIPIGMLVAISNNSPVLFLYTPDHHCKISEQHDLMLEYGLGEDEFLNLTIPRDEDTGHLSRCSAYDVDIREQLSQGTRQSDPNWPVIPCPNGWSYNLTGYFSSAVTDMDWVCDDAWRAPFTQSMFSIGGVVGTLVLGYCSDRFGRFPVHFGTNVFLFAVGIATPFCTNFIAFSFIRLAMGLTYNTFYSPYLILVLEYVPTDMRAIVAMSGVGAGMGIGGVLHVWVLKAMGDWVPYVASMFALAGLVFVTPLYVCESVRWLLSQNKIDKAVDVLKYIARFNGKELTDAYCSKFREFAESHVAEQQMREGLINFGDVWTHPRVRRNTFLMLATWMILSGTYDGHIRNVANLKSDVYTTLTIYGCLELPIHLITMVLLTQLGRRWSICGNLTISAVSMVICGLTLDHFVVNSVFAVLGRFFMGLALAAGVQITYEILPTDLRAQGASLAAALGHICIFVSPYVAYLAVVSPMLPFFILGGAGFVGSLTAFFLPETADVDLPETIEDAEDFGQGQSLFTFPFLERERLRKAELAKAVRRISVALESKVTNSFPMKAMSTSSKATSATSVASTARRNSTPVVLDLPTLTVVGRELPEDVLEPQSSTSVNRRLSVP